MRRNLGFRPRLARLADLFTDARAAGALNSTLATDGHSLRTVVDTAGDKFSTNGVALVCAGGSGAWGDPGIWWPAQARVPGKLLIVKIKPTDATQEISVGWDGNQTTNIGENGLMISNDLFKWIDGNGAGPGMGIPADGTEYTIIVIHRAVGAQFLVRGGAYVPMRLLGMSAFQSGTPLYPTIISADGSFSAYYALFPSSVLWLAAPLLSDSFARTDGVLGTTDGAGHAETTGVGSGGSGLPWVFDAGCWTISGNTAMGAPTLGAELATGALVVGNWYSITATEVNYFYVGSAIADTFRAAATTALDANNKVKLITLTSMFATANLGTPNVYGHCEVKTLTTGTQAGAVLRLDSAASPANFLLVNFDGAGNIKIVEAVAGAYTQLASVASAFTAADVLVVDLDGAAYRVYKVATSGTGTATLISAGTTNVLTGNLHGTFSTYSGNAFERVAIWAKGTEGQYETPLWQARLRALGRRIARRTA